MPPFLLIHGTADPLVPFEQSRNMCDRMRAAGASCELLPVEGAGHGMRWWQTSAVAAYQSAMLSLPQASAGLIAFVYEQCDRARRAIFPRGTYAG